MASTHQQYATSELEVTLPPVDLGNLGPISEDNSSLYWRYYRCLEDHLVDFSRFSPSHQFFRSWAYTGISVPQSTQCTLLLGSNCLIDIWLNGQLIHHYDEYQGKIIKKFSIQATLHAGINNLLVRFDTKALGQTPYAFALKINDTRASDAQISLPTEIEASLIEKRLLLENVIEKAYLDRYVYGYLTGDRYDKNEPIVLQFSSDIEKPTEISHRLQSLRGDIFQSGIKNTEAGAKYELARLFPLRNGPHHLSLLPEEGEYYQKKMQFDRKELFWVVRTPFSFNTYGTFANRAREALEDAAKRRSESIFIEIAKIALFTWEKVDQKILDTAVSRIQQHQDGSIVDLLGLLYILVRFRKKKKLSDKLLSTAETAILNFYYWTEERPPDNPDFLFENQQFLVNTCEILAGQLLSNEVFVNSGKTGNWHQQNGEELAIAWMQKHGQYGFQEWDSPALLESTITALTLLVDLAKSETLRELAAVLLDKIFFSLAVNTWKGMLGSSQGRSDTASVLSHRLEATSGITRLMWGLGNFNENVMGVVSLACSRKYQLPETIYNIALDAPAALWSKEGIGSVQPTISSPVVSPSENLTWEVNKVIYKTDDYMLASAQNYCPGQPGKAEHIWQATLGPDAVVFVNHPGNLSENDAHLPNLWVGNKTLPRVAQWGDVLISLNKLSLDDWLGFTHAYFPASAFDEYDLAGNWAFARKGKGYLALYSSLGLEWITSGKTALRELRSLGTENIWLCHMGQEILDGSFADFQTKIQAMDLKVEGLSVQLTSLRGETLSFAWEGPLLVNSQEQALSGYRHYENLYSITELPAQQIEILYGEEGIRLVF